MVVFINGSFGVGKTTVARLLRGRVAGSAVYDPELAGIAMMRLSNLAGFKRTAAEDFQDFALWRRSAVAGVRLFRALFRGPVIVPMTFTRREYFDEVVAGVRRFDPQVRVFCLRAGLPTVRKRLAGRESETEGPGAEWLARRIAECADAHRDPHFGEPIETEDRPPREVCEDIFRRVVGRQ
ncbi:MAG TPA: AAA family ATPase [Pyrinomonadaceae bacterium]|jgi:hypothetical protein